MHPTTLCILCLLVRTAAASLALVSIALPLRAEEVTVIWSSPKCEMIFVEKPEAEFGTVLRLSDGRTEIGDKLEGDFGPIDQIRKIRNLNTGEEIMMRGVRYSSSRKYVLKVLPKWCKGPTE